MASQWNAVEKEDARKNRDRWKELEAKWKREAPLGFLFPAPANQLIS
jgi:hypothetical protein